MAPAEVRTVLADQALRTFSVAGVCAVVHHHASRPRMEACVVAAGMDTAEGTDTGVEGPRGYGSRLETVC